jgi:hypothetical protein
VSSSTAALTGNYDLHALTLQNIGCSVNACAAVLELTVSCALQKLHLFNNMSDNEGALSISKLIERNPGMQVRLRDICAVVLVSGMTMCRLSWRPLHPAYLLPLGQGKELCCH